MQLQKTKLNRAKIKSTFSGAESPRCFEACAECYSVFLRPSPPGATGEHFISFLPVTGSILAEDVGWENGAEQPGRRRHGRATRAGACVTSLAGDAGKVAQSVLVAFLSSKDGGALGLPGKGLKAAAEAMRALSLPF